MKRVAAYTLRATLKLLARLTLWRYQPDIVGITGSVGKTSAKEAVRDVLSFSRRVRAPSKSFNNELGIPLTILGEWDHTGGIWFWIRVLSAGLFRIVFRDSGYPEVLVLEYGIDHPGDMSYLLSIARPHVGVFTAMGAVPVHVEFFPSPEAVLKEKAKLIAQLPLTGFAVLNADDPHIEALRHQTRARVVTYGFSERADVRVTNLQHSFDGAQVALSLKLTYGGSFVPVRMEGAAGKAQGYATAVGAVVGLVFGMNLVKIAESLMKYRTPAGRFSIVRGIRQSVLVDDTYNASPVAVEEALATLKTLRAKRKIAVLGDMLELGKYTLESHEQAGRLASQVVDMLVTVGLRGKFIAEAAIRAGLSRRRVYPCMHLSDAVDYLQEHLRPGDLVLLKASQGVRLEKVVYELMAEPERAGELLVRQNEEWKAKSGLYDEPR